jgi:hypothetical protein
MPPSFQSESIRLLRENWGQNVQALAEEAYAIFQTKMASTSAAPTTINNEGAGPSQVINQPQSGQSIVFNPRPLVPPQLPDSSLYLGMPEASIDIGSDGGLILEGSSISFSIPDGTGAFQTYNLQDILQQIQEGGGGGFPGVVVSGGPGVNYQVRVWPQGFGGPPQVVPVQQLQIPADETIPADTWVIAVKAGNAYYMQHPLPTSMPGEVMGKSTGEEAGAGDRYEVTVWPYGYTNPSKVVNVTQLDIDPDSTIPTGTAVMVTRATDDWYMQVPVWQEDLPP